MHYSKIKDNLPRQIKHMRPLLLTHIPVSIQIIDIGQFVPLINFFQLSNKSIMQDLLQTHQTKECSKNMGMKTNKLTTRQYKPKKKKKEYLRTMHQETKLTGLWNNVSFLQWPHLKR
jgi:hypothetical protein